MIKKRKIPTILGIVILVVGVLAGVFLLRSNQIFKIGASPGISPKDVRIGNISDSSATISWFTDDQTFAFVSYGTTSNVGTVADESSGDQKYSTHIITLTGLKPETIYYFKINSDGTNFDNNGVAWQFTTGKLLPVSKTSMPVSGSVLTASGEAAGRAIIYINIGGYIVSSVTSDNGTFVLQLGSARTSNLSSYASIDPQKTLLDISITSQGGEVATAKIFPQSANPIPPLIIGQSQDFRNLEPSGDGQNPGVDLNLPEDATQESKFDLEDEIAEQPTNVTLDSIDEGEIITSDAPEFFGDGPQGTEITITVHSDTNLTGSTTVGSSGTWKWSPPSNLSEGSHSVTISWIDSLGITRTLTRNFIVQAGELPAFVSTPSATPTLTPTPRVTPTPTLTPTPTATISSTPASMPQSGDLTPTLVLSIMGVAVLMFGAYAWKLSDN